MCRLENGATAAETIPQYGAEDNPRTKSLISLSPVGRARRGNGVKEGETTSRVRSGYLVDKRDVGANRMQCSSSNRAATVWLWFAKTLY